jgi:choline dehydrogenase
MGERFDVVVVGGGASGAVLAARLSEDGSRSVLLLEAGSVTPDPQADLLSNVTFALTMRDWGLDARATPDRTVPFPQGRALGGGSAVNMALALRPLPEDMQAWEAAGNPGWGWSDMLRCLRRLEHDDLGEDEVHGASGPIPVARWQPGEYTDQQRAFLDGCRSIGLAAVDDHNDGTSSGVGPFPMNRRAGVRVSTAIGYVEPARGRPNLAVRGDALVDRVLVSAGRAVGVEVVVDGQRETVAAGEVVVSCGSIQTPALLMRSGIGPAALLQRHGIPVVVDLAGVGAGLMEHPGAFLFVLPADGVCNLDEVQFQVGARTTAPGSADRNDLLLGMMSHWDLRPMPDLRAAVGADVIFTLTCGVLLPRARGSVEISDRSPEVAPRVDLNLGGHPEDERRLVVALRMLRDIAGSDAMRDRVRGFALLDDAAWDSDAALAAYVHAVSAPWYHPAGTCRMGPAADGATVVDHTLRVHGIAGLRVADLSIAPTIPRATTNLTAIAIGERAAEIMA